MKRYSIVILSTLFCCNVFAAESDTPMKVDDAAIADRFAELALGCVHKEYPNSIKHMLVDDSDVRPPSQLYPAFYGCYDWHSSVHGHWLLSRIGSQYPESAHSQAISASLKQSFSAANISGELAYFNRPDTGTTFERPYGLAWFLQLMVELRQWDNATAQQWVATLEPLETKIVANLSEWIPKLTFPIRAGEHSQTAFAFGLMYDWSLEVNNGAFRDLLVENVYRLYSNDVDCPLAYEPSGQDFLSPCLAEADLMRRVMPSAEFSQWLSRFLPQITADNDQWLSVATVSDKSDGKLAHLDGLNLSRAWMLEGVASTLVDSDSRKAVILKAAAEHKAAGISAVIGDMHYMGSHWLGSFATYLMTQRGGGIKAN